MALLDIPVWTWMLEHYVIDLWSLYHLLAWFGGLFILQIFQRLSWHGVLVLGLLSSYGWEVAEYHLEIIHHAPWREPFLNRWVSDPFFNMVGAFLGWGLCCFLIRKWASKKTARTF